ncbi:MULTISPECIES: YpmS family protein [Bacillus]|uniref:YpmS family protein n=1 Tax=Bacillus TaxID=1386 RepID=UPI0002EE7746|nr:MULTISPECIES: YpmS family protein [Bacillus]
MRSRTKKRNVWKILFFTLVGIIVASLLSIVILVGIPSEVPEIDNSKSNSEETSILLQSNKESLNQLINNNIAKYQKTGSFQYDVRLTDVIELYTTIPVFDNNLQLKMTFKPYTLENGDLLLKQETMKLGQMKLPVSYVMNFIKKQNDLPEWLVINPKKEEIQVLLSEIILVDHYTMKVNNFDLKKDDISFRLVIPSEGVKSH